MKNALIALSLVLGITACNKSSKQNGGSPAVQTTAQQQAEAEAAKPTVTQTEAVNLPTIPGQKDVGVVDIVIDPEVGKCKKIVFLSEIMVDCPSVESSSNEKIIPKGPFGETLLFWIWKSGKRAHLKVRVTESEILKNVTFYYLIVEKLD